MRRSFPALPPLALALTLALAVARQEVLECRTRAFVARKHTSIPIDRRDTLIEDNPLG